MRFPPHHCLGTVISEIAKWRCGLRGGFPVVPSEPVRLPRFTTAGSSRSGPTVIAAEEQLSPTEPY